MRTRKMGLLVAVAAGALLLEPGSASAWVAVGVARPVARVAGAAAVGVAAGAVAGAAVASASQPSTVVVTPPPAVVTPPPAPPGGMITTLPSGCVSSGGRYQCGSVWYQPYFGSNGVYYQVVAP